MPLTRVLATTGWWSAQEVVALAQQERIQVVTRPLARRLPEAQIQEPGSLRWARSPRTWPTKDQIQKLNSYPDHLPYQRHRDLPRFSGFHFGKCPPSLISRRNHPRGIRFPNRRTLTLGVCSSTTTAIMTGPRIPSGERSPGDRSRANGAPQNL